jgi:hypothetical protein
LDVFFKIYRLVRVCWSAREEPMLGTVVQVAMSGKIENKLLAGTGFQGGRNGQEDVAGANRGSNSGSPFIEERSRLIALAGQPHRDAACARRCVFEHRKVAGLVYPDDDRRLGHPDYIT